MSIIWLASYPKSGNTWLRTFLTNYLNESDHPADINTLIGRPIGIDRNAFDELLGIESSDLLPNEINRYRPIFYELLAADHSTPLFIKVHDAYIHSRIDRPLFPKKATTGVIYLIRNPLDIAVSFAYHANEPLDKIINHMACDTYTMLDQSDRLYDVFPQTLLSWSKHVQSWQEQTELKTHVVRYEDMLLDPVSIFSKILQFSNIEPDVVRLKKALQFSCFSQLQYQESKQGFVEKQPTAPSFFRQGRAGVWRNQLSKKQEKKIITSHYRMMKQLGYLTEMLFS